MGPGRQRQRQRQRILFRPAITCLESADLRAEFGQTSSRKSPPFEPYPIEAMHLLD